MLVHMEDVVAVLSAFLDIIMSMLMIRLFIQSDEYC